MGSTIEHADRRKYGKDNQLAEHHREQQHETTTGEKGSRNRGAQLPNRIAEVDSKKQIKNVSSSGTTIRKGRRVDQTAARRKHATEDEDHQLERIADEKNKHITQMKIQNLLKYHPLSFSAKEQKLCEALNSSPIIYPEARRPVHFCVFSWATRWYLQK